MTPAGPRRLPRRHTFDFQSIILEGMHQFHLNFTEALGSLKYRSSSKMGVIQIFVTELWPFFDLDFG